MKRLGIHGMVSALVVVAVIFFLGGVTPAAAGGTSGYSTNKSSGGSVDLKKKYDGGSYGLPGRIEMKKKYGYELETDTKKKSPDQSPTFGQNQGPVKIEQRQEMNLRTDESEKKKEEPKKESTP